MAIEEAVTNVSDISLDRYLYPQSTIRELDEVKPLEKIPTVDIGSVLENPTKANLETAAKGFREAHEQIGFLSIINHGVPWQTIDSAFDAIKEFFSLPLDAKMKIKFDKISSGYYPPNSTVYVSSPVNNNTKGDLNENLRLVKERSPEHPAIKSGMRFHGPNQWPDNVENFKPRMIAYYDSMEKLGRSLLPVYARALDLPKNWFDNKFDDPMWATRNSFYPAGGGKNGAEENQFGIAPHCDHGFITMLPVSKEPGLQVLARTGNWINVEIPDKAILVNAGEFMHRWTNGRFFATPHRVLPPKKDRYSLGFFYNPTRDVRCDPMETCCNDDNPAKYDGMSMVDYLSWYVDRNYLKSHGGQQ